MWPFTKKLPTYDEMLRKARGRAMLPHVNKNIPEGATVFRDT